jgi:uridine phosphorylase
MIGESELLINSDGSIFHLHLKPGQISDTVILVGDPGRAKMISGMFSKTELTVENREFITRTGIYRNQRITVVSTGIGPDNIDIAVNELDAITNIDLKKREPVENPRSLKLIRIGTTGGLQADIPVNSWIVSRKSIGFDGMLTYYANRESVCDMAFEKAFKSFVNWPDDFPSPYVVDGSAELLQKFSGDQYIQGVNVSAPGFYGPQGRVLRLPLAFPGLNELLGQFRYGDLKITNYEMESSAIYGLAALLGHEAMTVCLLIANRITLSANENYQAKMKGLIQAVLDTLTGHNG